MPETVLSTFVNMMLSILPINLRDIISILQKLNDFLRVTGLLFETLSPLAIPHFSLVRRMSYINVLYKTGGCLLANWEVGTLFGS